MRGRREQLWGVGDQAIGAGGVEESVELTGALSIVHEAVMTFHAQ